MPRTARRCATIPPMSLCARIHDGPAGENVWTATGRERPVFLDEHGRRRRWVLLGGALTGGASALWLGALIAGAIGFSTMPSLQERSPLIRSPLIASRAVHHVPAQPLVARHRHAVSHGRNSSSPLNETTELAVSRGLIAAR